MPAGSSDGGRTAPLAERKSANPGAPEVISRREKQSETGGVCPVRALLLAQIKADIMRKTALLTGVAGLFLMTAPAFAQDSTAQQTPPTAAPPASEQPQSLSVRPGMTVRGSDGSELGKLEGVRDVPGGQEITVRGADGQLRGVPTRGLGQAGDALTAAWSNSQFLAAPAIADAPAAPPATEPVPAPPPPTSPTPDQPPAPDPMNPANPAPGTQPSSAPAPDQPPPPGEGQTEPDEDEA